MQRLTDFVICHSGGSVTPPLYIPGKLIGYVADFGFTGRSASLQVEGATLTSAAINNCPTVAAVVLLPADLIVANTKCRIAFPTTEGFDRFCQFIYEAR